MPETTSTFGGRLGEWIERRGLTPNALAGKLGTSPSRVKSWLDDASLPGGDNLIRIAEALRINVHWLLTNEGGPELPPEPGADPYVVGATLVIDRVEGLLDALRRDLGRPARDGGAPPVIPASAYRPEPRPSERKNDEKKRA